MAEEKKVVEEQPKQEELKFEVIYAILNAGFADQAMVAAREVGAKGGTIIHARGSSNIGVDKKYGLTMTPDKEVLMILATTDEKDKIINAIYTASIKENNHKGIVFKLNLGILSEKRGPLHFPWNTIPATKIGSGISLLSVQSIRIVYDNISEPLLGYPEEADLHSLSNKPLKFGCAIMIPILHGIKNYAEIQKVEINLCQQFVVIIVIVWKNINQNAIILCIIWMLDISISCTIEYNLRKKGTYLRVVLYTEK